MPETTNMKKLLLAYVPVLHNGYLRLFQEHADASELGILGPELIAQFPHLAKNLPALEPEKIATAVRSWNIFPKVVVWDFPDLERCHNNPPDLIVSPDEDVTRALIADFLPVCKVKFLSIFLRRDKQSTLKPQAVVPGLTISQKRFDKEVMDAAAEMSAKSSDFWRQVGAAIVRDGQIILVTYNRHVPSAQTPYAYGDPRGNFKKGIHIELSTAIHAESALIAEAAKQGFSLGGADIYVTTFPCPVCAKLITYSGIKRVFFREGYSLTDGESILKENGVEIILVQ